MSELLLRQKLRGLYAISDEQLIPTDSFGDHIQAALEGGASVIQYRDKSTDADKRLRQARQLRQLCADYNALCIINDDIELAKAVDAHGVHLGKDDQTIQHARQALGEKAIIGVSCYNRLSLAVAAEKHSADYVAFGAMFASRTKPEACLAGADIIGLARSQVSIPVCAIGGISLKKMPTLIEQGVDMAAVISSLFSADDIQATARRFSQHFHSQTD